MTSLPQLDSDEFTMAVAQAALSALEINSTLAELFATDRELALKLAEAEGAKHDRERRS